MRIFFFLIVVLALAIAGLIYFSENVQKIFVYSQPPEPADVILILGGWDSKFRVEHGVDLYKGGYASKILISEGFSICEIKAADIMKEYAQKLGVPANDILIEKDSQDTEENATMVKNILDAHGFKKIILVTADYHSRRSAKVFSNVLGPDYQIISNPAIIYGQEDWQNWCKQERLREFVLMEIFKYINYLIF